MGGNETAQLCLYCEVCGWTARAPTDGTTTAVSEQAFDHFHKTGHTPIRQR